MFLLRVFLLEVTVQLLVGLIFGAIAFSFVVIASPIFLFAFIFSKPLTEEEKIKLEQEREKRYRQPLPFRCGCCSGSHRQISYIN